MASKNVKAIIDQLNQEIQAIKPRGLPMVEYLKGFKYQSSNGKIKIEVVEAIQNGDQIETVTKDHRPKSQKKNFQRFYNEPLTKMSEQEIINAHLKAQIVIEETRARVLRRWPYNVDFNLQAQAAINLASSLREYLKEHTPK